MTKIQNPKLMITENDLMQKLLKSTAAITTIIEGVQLINVFASKISCFGHWILAQLNAACGGPPQSGGFNRVKIWDLFEICILGFGISIISL